MDNTIWAVVPAAGCGSRMGASIPKQYLPLQQSTVLECTLSRLLSVRFIDGIVVVVDDETSFRNTMSNSELSAHIPIRTVIGGDTRTQSVLNGLLYLQQQHEGDHTVLVHDAARPCVRSDDIEKLVERCAESDDGGLLAVPMYDTLKRGDESDRVSGTIDRVRAWRAATPQLFSRNLLIDALHQAMRTGVTLTDEASAMENAGYRPLLVPCVADNIKITESADLAMANVILQAQELTRAEALSGPSVIQGQA
jgi:2-C-methyl-D-erythritol 4-phosphate cytidylyltransferase